MKALTSEVPWEMSLAACPAPESPTDSSATGTEQPNPRALAVLAATLARPLVAVDPDASGPRFPPGRPNPFGNRHQRRAHNAKARRTP